LARAISTFDLASSAIGDPIGAELPSEMMIAAKIPLWKDSMSMLALSDLTMTTLSPLERRSPSDLRDSLIMKKCTDVKFLFTLEGFSDRECRSLSVIHVFIH
jgi:hypothetical protein